jgi:hypothetical protein
MDKSKEAYEIMAAGRMNRSQAVVRIVETLLKPS